CSQHPMCEWQSSAVGWGEVCIFYLSFTAERGGSVTIPCHYDQKYKHHVKYWCKGYHWSTCTIMVRSDSRQSKGDVSINDDPDQLVFTVTMRNLQDKDSGTYWCAVEINGGSDDAVILPLIVRTGKLKFVPDVVFIVSEEISVLAGKKLKRSIDSEICSYDSKMKLKLNRVKKRKVSWHISCLLVTLLFMMFLPVKLNRKQHSHFSVTAIYKGCKGSCVYIYIYFFFSNKNREQREIHMLGE
uniref:Immunoglobulin domain-containing protein n=1 Tax=Scleropages formosus TaxID=113540 RepID=A0A8C9V4N4_SCLFO